MASKFMAPKLMAPKFMASKFMASKFMASKFMVNAAFEARLLLRPSHQRTVWTVNKLKCPIPGRPTLPPILSSRSYSDSTSTPLLLFLRLYSALPSSSHSPFPKSSGSTEGSQSSGPEDKNWFYPKAWARLWAAAQLVLYVQAPFMCQLKHADYQRLCRIYHPGNVERLVPDISET